MRKAAGLRATVAVVGLCAMLPPAAAAQEPSRHEPSRHEPGRHEPGRPPSPERSAAQPSRGHDWTGAYVGVHAGAAVGGGRARGAPAGSDDDARYPPSRTRTRP